MASSESRKVTLTNYVGLDTLPHQIERKLLKRGFQFNIMVVGATGLGKSTLMNTIFAAHLVESKAPKKPSEMASRQTTEIVPITHSVEENGVKVKLTIIDTPGFGDQVNNENCWDPVVKYVRDQYSIYLRRELTPARDKRIPDTRVHAILYFIAPTGHALKPLDIQMLRMLSGMANVIPVIAKSDSLTLAEREAFKRRINDEISFNNIKVYPYVEEDVFDSSNGAGGLSELDRAERQLNASIRDMLPFAIVGSERNVVIEGKAVRGRRTRWGVVNVEDETHCEFVHLRNFLLRTHMQDLIETTALTHYENFRTKQLLALKELTAQPGAKPAVGAAVSSPPQPEPKK